MRYRLKQLRKEKGWTQQETAEIIGLSLDMVKSIENGRVNPSLMTAWRIKQAFGCSCIDELIESSI